MNFLGPNFQWFTQLDYSGSIDENGVLNGNLYLVGSGDPSLGTNKAGATSFGMISLDFVAALAEKGIKKVQGDIIVQTAIFKANKLPMLPENIVWLEQGTYYLPVGSTKDIDPTKEKIVVKQNNPFQQEKKYFYISPYIKKIVFAEEYQPSPLTTTLPPPPTALANSLRATMLKSGIPILGKVTAKLIDNEPEKRMLISTYRSPDLNDIVYYTNQHSDNALAEATLRLMGFQKFGDQSLDSGKRAVLEHLSKIGFDTEHLTYMDGSGLSRAHTITPISQVKFLSSLMNEKYYKNFYDSLPIGGQTGTLKRMFVYGNGNGQVFAKTGTLNKVKTLAGYIKTNSGKTLVFSLLVNNFAGSVDMVKKRMEMILEPVFGL
jgi:D-alanyl-D-alanine carboxypeptidase/D-alanyl-D-alanine-endopeptidase (penicillin-binding protein 4)